MKKRKNLLQARHCNFFFFSIFILLKMPAKTKKNPPTKQKKLFNDDIFKASVSAQEYREIHKHFPKKLCDEFHPKNANKITVRGGGGKAGSPGAPSALTP